MLQCCSLWRLQCNTCIYLRSHKYISRSPIFLAYSDQIVQQVLDELGLQIEGDLSAIPSTGSSVAQAGGAAKQPVAAGGVNDADADLEARLDALRRN